MSHLIDVFGEEIRRRAVVMQVGGDKRGATPMSSWFGRVAVGLPGDVWPESDGQPMQALCQINLTELPLRPPGLEELAFLAIFISSDELPSNTPNGKGWCLRVYKDLGSLVPLEPVETRSSIKLALLRPTVVDADYPCWEDVAEICPEEIENDYLDRFENVSGIKLGGWPTLIQSEIYWAPWNKHPASPRYVFQIDSVAECHWQWGDGGVGYFGRGTTPGLEDEWAFEWQCY